MSRRSTGPRKRRNPGRVYDLPAVLTIDCTKKCACPHPVPQPCGCVNHAGGEVTYCPTHEAAPDMWRAVTAFLAKHQNEATATNHVRCGCVDCVVFRAVILKATRDQEQRAAADPEGGAPKATQP